MSGAALTAGAADGTVAEPREVEALMLSLGVALTMTGDAVSEVQEYLRSTAAAYGYPGAHISVLPTLLLVALREGDVAGVRTIDSSRQLRLDQSSEVIQVARSVEAAEITPSEALARLDRRRAIGPRFGAAYVIGSHALLTVGLGLVIGPASSDTWLYLLLGALVGAMKVWWSASGRVARFSRWSPRLSWRRSPSCSRVGTRPHHCA